MAIFEKPLATARPFADRVGDDLPPEGTFKARIEDIVDEFGIERKKFQSEEKEVVDLTAFLFSFLDAEGKNRLLSTPYMRISGHERSTLYGFLKSMLGRPFEYGKNYMELKGHSCLLTVGHVERHDGSGVYPTIVTISPLPPGMSEHDAPGGTADVSSAAAVAEAPGF